MYWINRLSFYLSISLSVAAFAPTALFAKQDRSSQQVRLLQNELHNLTTEMAILDDKIEIQDQTIAALRQQIMEEISNQRQGIQKQSRGVEEQLKNLESNYRGVRQDLDKIRRHNNELVAGLEGVKKQLTQLDEAITQQDRNQANLQKALTSLMDAIQSDHKRPSVQKSTTYTVQSGDSLDKIARKFKITVEGIKKANQLEKDLIVIGQKLIIP
ncbi:MAG: hypothetical protein CMO81_10470 [Waddliaceae bacterium]|nr:hypothetical protein [Waddliaceae bacterium]